MKIRYLITTLILLAGCVAVCLALRFGRAEESGKQQEISIDPLTEAAYYSDSGRSEEALVLYHRILESEPDNAEALRGVVKNAPLTEYRKEVYDTYDHLITLRAASAEEILEYLSILLETGEREKAAEVSAAAAAWCTDPEVLALHGQIHVHAPTFNIEGGTYRDYQLLELTDAQEDCEVYYTIDGSEPTRDSEKYTEPLIISHPSTEVRAKAYSKMDFESEETDLVFTITAPVIEYENTPRASLINSIRRNIFSKGNREVLYSYELAQVTSIYIVANEAATSYPGSYTFHEGSYSYNNGRDKTTMGNNDLSILEGMPFLKTLALCNQQSVDMEMIGRLTHLKQLSLLNDGIEDISALGSLHELTDLSLGWNRISDVRVLGDLTQLKALGLWGNQISDISSLADLEELTKLDLSDNEVRDISALEDLSELKYLWIRGNHVSRADAEELLGQLKELY